MDVDAALAEVPVNLMPLIDDTDFKSIEAAVVYNATGLALLWHFVTTAGAMTETAVTPTSGGLHDWSDQGTSGLYAIEIPTASGDINNTIEGFGWFTGVATGVLPWRGPVIGFRAAALNNALIDGATAPAVAGDAMTLAAGAVTDASLAGGLEIVYETDFGTNYNVTRKAWETNVQDFVGTTAADPFAGKVVAASVTGAVGSVTGAVGSVTGAVGSVTGSVGSNLELGPAEVNTEVDNAIQTYGLDHLVQTSVAGADVADNSIIAKMVASGATADWDTFVNTTESLQALRDHIADGTNLTEAGGDGDHLSAIPGASDPWLTALPGAYGAGTAGEILGDWKDAGRLDAILDTVAADVVNVDGYNLATQIGTAGAGLTNVGASGNNWNTVVPDAAGVAPTAAEVVNEWETQSQADPTGFHVNTMEVNSNTSAAPNLALQYDGTGYVDDTAPATQAQLGALTVGSGGIATTANSDTTVTTGSETLTYTATAELDLSYHEVAPVSTIDMYYEFDISSSGVPISVDWTGYVQSNNDNVEVSFLNWPSTYEQVGTIEGAAGTTPTTQQFLATTAHVGTGSNVGKVRIKFSSDGGDVATNLATDRIICTYTQAVTGIANGSTVTLSATTSNTNLVGNNWVLALGGQAITGSYISGATVTGIASGSGVTFEDCHFGAGTYPPGTYVRCGFGSSDGLFTAASNGEYIFKDCFSIVAGAGTPDFTFAGLGSATGINVRGWYGGSAWTLDTNCTMSLEVVQGGGTTITPADAAVEIRGACRELTLALADTDIGNTIQAIIDTGPITITSAGSSDSATINLYGHAQSLSDASNGTTNNYLSGFVQTDAILTDTAVIGAAGAGLTAINLPNQTMDIVGNITGNLSGSVGSLTGHTNQTGDSYAIVNGSAGLVAIDTVVDAIKVTTDKFQFTVANFADCNIQYVNDVLVNGTGAAGDEWGP